MLNTDFYICLLVAMICATLISFTTTPIAPLKPLARLRAKEFG